MPIISKKDHLKILAIKKRRYGYILAWLLSLLSAATIALVFRLSPVALSALLGVPAFGFLAALPVAGIAWILAVSTLIVSAAIFSLLVHTYTYDRRRGHFFSRYPMLSTGITAFAVASLLVAFIPGAVVAISSIPAFAFLGMMGGASPFIAPLIVGAAAALIIGFLAKIAINSYQDRCAKSYDAYTNKIHDKPNRFLQALSKHSRIATLSIGAAVVGLVLGLTAGFVPAIVPGFIAAFGFGAPLTALVFGLMVAATVVIALGIPTIALSRSHRQRIVEPEIQAKAHALAEVTVHKHYAEIFFRGVRHGKEIHKMIDALRNYQKKYPNKSIETLNDRHKMYDRVYKEQYPDGSYRQPNFLKDTDQDFIMREAFPPLSPPQPMPS